MDAPSFKGYNNYKSMIGPKKIEFVESSEDESEPQ
jgi:hypothetical protein